ncbi:MAG: DUF4260 family protein [Candidatus Hydrogenedentes bacterium]|nr:DUF4260 family protein [Candidatus Hydrogenedentota bacterium]
MNFYLRIESAAILLWAVGLYWWLGAASYLNWGLFVLFAILPDLSFFAFLQRDKKALWPNLMWNIAHTYATPLILMVLFMPYQPLFLLGWVAHIAFDRTIGLGFRFHGQLEK